MTPRSHADKLGDAIRAAVVEGYIQGVHHTKGRSVMAEAERIADAFWRRVNEAAVARRQANLPRQYRALFGRYTEWDEPAEGLDNG